MKKKLFLPLLTVLAVTLLSFKPGSGNTGVDVNVITCNDGTVIIPSGVNMTASDQAAIVGIMSSYGSDAGYFVYRSGGVTQTYNAPASTSTLSSADAAYGSDLYSGKPGTGWAIYKETVCLTMAKQILYKASTTTTSMHDELAPILAKYGYME
jgi:hypothetical protein